MLPNQATYQKYLENNGEGVSYEDPVELKNVKIDEQMKVTYTSNGKEIVGSAMLFYDMVNSSGLTEKPVNESKITFKGRVYKVVDTDILRANDDTPHHYEVLLK